MSEFADGQPLDLEKLRARPARMSDDELKRFGAAARYMCSPQANGGEPPRDAFVIQLKEAIAEWRRRQTHVLSLRLRYYVQSCQGQENSRLAF